MIREGDVYGGAVAANRHSLFQVTACHPTVGTHHAPNSSGLLKQIRLIWKTLQQCFSLGFERFLKLSSSRSLRLGLRWCDSLACRGLHSKLLVVTLDWPCPWPQYGIENFKELQLQLCEYPLFRGTRCEFVTLILAQIYWANWPLA